MLIARVSILLLSVMPVATAAQTPSVPVRQPLVRPQADAPRPVTAVSATDAPRGVAPTVTLPASQPESMRLDPLPIPAARPGDYIVNAGDQLEVYVWGEERLQRQLRVLPDGSFSFPLVGRLEAAGKTLPQIETYVSNGLQGQYRGRVPQVTVSVTLPSGLQFAVAGRVKTPGTFTPGRYVNLLEALTLAGGPDEFANLDNIVIVRKTPDGLMSVRARMAGVYKGTIGAGRVSADLIPAIQSGDTVIVP